MSYSQLGDWESAELASSCHTRILHSNCSSSNDIVRRAFSARSLLQPCIVFGVGDKGTHQNFSRRHLLTELSGEGSTLTAYLVVSYSSVEVVNVVQKCLQPGKLASRGTRVGVTRSKSRFLNTVDKTGTSFSTVPRSPLNSVVWNMHDCALAILKFKRTVGSRTFGS